MVGGAVLLPGMYAGRTAQIGTVKGEQPIWWQGAGRGIFRARLEGSGMRYAVVGALFACLAFSVSAIAEPAFRTVSNPKGDGDPNAFTCRAPQVIGGSLRIPHYGPAICATNQFWADVSKSGKIVDPNGAVVPAWMSTTINGSQAAMSMGPPAYYVGSQ